MPCEPALPPQPPDAGQPPVDDHGDATPGATALVVNGEFARGQIGRGIDVLDFFSVELQTGETYQFTATRESGTTPTFALLDTNGVSTLRSGSVSGTTTHTFTPATAGTYFLRVQRAAGAAGTHYRVAATRAPLADLSTSAVQLFSTVSAQTGGAFLVRDSVNFGGDTEYVAAMFNVMASTLGPAVLAVNPGGIPRDATLNLELTGRGTNWRPGATTLEVSGTGVEVLAVEVTSATSLTALVRIDPAALVGFRDVTVRSVLGDDTETAIGRNVLQVTPPVTGAAILSVEPGVLGRGGTRTVLVRGANTAWGPNSVVSFGAGITVDAMTVVSPTLISAQVTVSAAATIGFRTVSVTTPGVGTQQQTRATFVNAGVVAIPQLTGVSPSAGGRGQRLSVTVAGANTNFANGETTATFGDSIKVLSVTVVDRDRAVVDISVDPSAPLGFRDVSLRTGSEVAVLLGGFFVEPARVVADAGGPYTLAEGGAVQLSAGDSTGADPAALTYEWDFDGDGEFDDATGVAPEFSAVSLDGPNIVRVAVRVSEPSGASDTATAEVTLTNAAPALRALTSNAAHCGYVGEGQTVTLAGTFTDPGLPDTHTVGIDWGDGSTTAAQVVEPSRAAHGELSAGHVYTAGGVYEITVTITDDEGASHSSVLLAYVTGVGVIGGKLQIVGTAADDAVHVAQLGNGTYRVHAPFLPGGKRDVPGRNIEGVLALLCDGDDKFTVAGAVDVPIIVDGGDGADHLNGGNAGSVLLGGAGNDTLMGGQGRDLAIGGAGADRVVGNAGDDLIVAASTKKDGDYGFLSGFFDGSAALIPDDVLADSHQDLMTGSAGHDLFIVHNSGNGISDRVTDRAEEVWDLR